MGHTDDAMIDFLQKVSEPDIGGLVQYFPQGAEEFACCKIAVEEGYVIYDVVTNGVAMVTSKGRIELNRLLNAKNEAEREIERHEREKKQLRLDAKSIWHSRISLFISIIALVIVLWDRWCPPVPHEPTSHNIEKKCERSEPTGEKQEGECDI